MARDLVARLAAEPLSAIVHSGAMRTRRLAEALSATTGLPARGEPGWLERDFGTWEGRSWNAIWRETGSEMDRMMDEPATFRPGGGETSLELLRRVERAWRDLDKTGTTAVVAHGGSIAAARALIAGHPLERMIELVPPQGTILTIDLRPPSASLLFDAEAAGISRGDAPARG